MEALKNNTIKRELQTVPWFLDKIIQVRGVIRIQVGIWVQLLQLVLSFCSPLSYVDRKLISAIMPSNGVKKEFLLPAS